MERLTVKNEMGQNVLKRAFECERCNEPHWSIPDYVGDGSPTDRLAAYEETGLTPETIQRYLDLFPSDVFTLKC